MPRRRKNADTGLFESKLDEETREKILSALAAGVPPEVAAAYAGIVKRTFQSWMAQGRAAIAKSNGNLEQVLEKDPMARFALDVEQALASFVVGHMAEITAAGRRGTQGEWQALAWQLERRFPQWFSRRTRHEVTGAGGGPIQHAVTVAIPRSAWEQLPIDDRVTLSQILGKIDGEIVEGEAELLAIEA
jgi:hypothetical protein